MTTQTTPAPTTKQDNLFGICAALGEDIGIDPLWLRIGFAVALLFNLEVVLVTYFGLGVVVLASRLLAPKPKAAVTMPLAADPVVAEEPLRCAA
ncbi:hypothetical protein ASG29_09880 [Sphingomonas sp. Leaf412]|uniref:PspC domain-containing protein n=1 Tax=Sphingomonas sp. Leaf412 TaxID=1736370 RepID=UPI0006FA6360|nr:PspC domain-containing protein [Sphingomonas sp. Leaf412]KQT32139.1 hypothetical protein ASG29_09880 [Sphingomonas sp. Leaf412]